MHRAVRWFAANRVNDNGRETKLGSGGTGTAGLHFAELGLRRVRGYGCYIVDNRMVGEIANGDVANPPRVFEKVLFAGCETVVGDEGFVRILSNQTVAVDVIRHTIVSVVDFGRQGFGWHAGDDIAAIDEAAVIHSDQRGHKGWVTYPGGTKSVEAIRTPGAGH